MNCRLIDMPSFTDSGDVYVIVETPVGSRNKYKYHEASGQMMLDKVLPMGLYFSFNFGFIPSTRGEDLDPLDVLLVMEEPLFPGCLVRTRLLGAIEAEQSEANSENFYRNDRLICVANASLMHARLKSIEDVSPELLSEIGEFFSTYNKHFGKQFKTLGHADPQKARQLLEEARLRFQKELVFSVSD